MNFSHIAAYFHNISLMHMWQNILKLSHVKDNYTYCVYRVEERINFYKNEIEKIELLYPHLKELK